MRAAFPVRAAFAAVAALLIGCGQTVAPIASADASVDAPADGAATACITTPPMPGVFPLFDRSCTTDADCTDGVHGDCCGGGDVLGLRGGCAGAFALAEQAWAMTHQEVCDCRAFYRTDDHGTVPQPSVARVTCTMGRCTTSAATPRPDMCGPTPIHVAPRCGGACGMCPAGRPGCLPLPAACNGRPSFECLRPLCTGCVDSVQWDDVGFTCP